MIKFKHRGNFKNAEKFFSKNLKLDPMTILKTYAEMGLKALMYETPKDSGKTALSWSYEIENNRNGYSIIYKNDNVNDGVNIAILLQYGHGTNHGGYVQGIDYINPALQPIFESMADKAWREMK